MVPQHVAPSQAHFPAYHFARSALDNDRDPFMRGRTAARELPQAPFTACRNARSALHENRDFYTLGPTAVREEWEDTSDDFGPFRHLEGAWRVVPFDGVEELRRRFHTLGIVDNRATDGAGNIQNIVLNDGIMFFEGRRLDHAPDREELLLHTLSLGVLRYERVQGPC